MFHSDIVSDLTSKKYNHSPNLTSEEYNHLPNLTPEQYNRYRAAAANIQTVDELAELLVGIPASPALAFQAVISAVPVADTTLTLACLRHSDTGFWPSPWLENPAFHPFLPLAARYWTQALTANSITRGAGITAGAGLRWLLGHGHEALVVAHLPALEAHVLRGESPYPLPGRRASYDALEAAVAAGHWPAERLVRWRAAFEYGFAAGPGDGTDLLGDPRLPLPLLRGLLTPSLSLYGATACTALLRRDDVRRDPEARARLKEMRPREGRLQATREYWRLGADAMDDFEEVAAPFLKHDRSAPEILDVIHDALAQMLETNRLGVARRLGTTRLTELSQSPVAALRAQVILAVSDLAASAAIAPADTPGANAPTHVRSSVTAGR